MAEIIPFVPRDDYFRRKAESVMETEVTPNESPLTPKELYKQYSERSLQMCRDLVEFYKQSGRWNLTCEGHMLTAVRSLQSINAELAGANDASQDAR